MSYATDDFTESLQRVTLERAQIKRVVAAWGKGEGGGEDAGHYRWSQESASDWSGGFLMELLDGTYAYLTGWCDYTGWGCQDGAKVTTYTTQPTFAALIAEDEYGHAPSPEEWDVEPADLNRWLVESAKSFDAVREEIG